MVVLYTTFWIYLHFGLFCSVQFVLQFTVLVIPILLFFTCCAEYSNWIGSLLAIALPLVVFCGRLFTSPVAVRDELQESLVTSAITSFRAYMNIATATAILAVDFTVFPRRFAKAETYGTGLMDVGVGLYVFSMALVSREARQQPSESLVRGWKTLLALLVLGCGRLITTKAAAYQEHTSEYGVHWNFFFTLAFLKVSGLVLMLRLRKINVSSLDILIDLVAFHSLRYLPM